MSGIPDQRIELELDKEQAELEESLSPIQPVVPIQPVKQAVEMNLPFALSEAQKTKLNNLEGVIAGIEKDHGEGSIFTLSQTDVIEHAEFIPTGILPIDSILGGGFARSRIIELFGPEGSGKTSLAYLAAAAAQRLGGIAGLVDVEHAFEPVRSVQLGVNPAALLVSQPEYGEQALEIVESLAESGQVDVVIVDSVAALVPKAELDGEMTDQQMGLQARMLGKAMRKMKGKVREGRCCVIFINQLRMKIGQMFGNPEDTPGGRALKFFADVRLDIRRGELLKVGDTTFGQKCVVKAVKNKLCPPFAVATYSLYYDNRGIDELESIIDLAREKGLIAQRSSWFAMSMNCPPELAKWNGLNLAQGELNIRDALVGNDDLRKALISHLTDVVIKRRQTILETLSNQHSLGLISGKVPENEIAKKRGRGRPKKES